MKQFITNTLSAISVLAAVPTGWAIFAGVTQQPAFPMNTIAAIVGAVAVIATSIHAGLLVTDIKAYDQGLKKIERGDFEMSSIPAWAVFGGCVLAEITLSLLVVIFPAALAFGVLVFPLMTAAGVFAFAIRFDLQKREQDVEALRKEKKTEKEVARKNKQQAQTLPQESVKTADVAPKVARKPVKDDDLLAFLASNPGASQQQVADHFGITRQAVGPRIKKLYEVKQ